MIKRFNEMITENMDETIYKIYTSKDGIIEFKKSDLNILRNNIFLFPYNFIKQYESLQNNLEIKVNFNDMFVYIETSNGDGAEYKIF